jgi:cyclophilin family peptidyl-prolyl cis-trans isomerase
MMAQQWSKAPDMQIDPNKNYTAVFHTDKGDFTVELYAKDAPLTVNNFVFLARQHYYDGVTFHRVIPGFMAQTGDPTGTGTGGPGYNLPDEQGGLALKHDVGILSMANTGRPNSGGSQFFIVYSREATKHLNGKHAVFGKVISGLDVVNSIKERDPMKDRTPGDKITSIDIIEG